MRGAGLGRGALWVLVLALAGCSQKDAAKCSQSLDATRSAIGKAEFNAAAQSREAAWKYCDDRSALEALDKQLVDERARVAAAQAAELEQKHESSALAKLLATFAGDNRAAPEHASQAPVCEGDAAPDKKPNDPKAKDRFCVAKRKAGKFTLEARYWEAEPAAVRFAARPPGPVTCDDLGPNRVVKTWQVPATGGRTAERSHCEFMGGTLSGLEGLVSAASNAYVYIFSPAYLEKDPAMKKMVSGP